MEIHTRVDECRHIFSVTKKRRLWLKREADTASRIIQGLRFANSYYKTLLRKRKEMCLGEKLFFPFHPLVLFFIPVN